MGQILWILDYLDDIDADFRVFYRIDGVADEQFGGLSAERFFMLVERLPAYRGVLRARAEAELQQQQQKRPQQIGGTPQGVDRDQFTQRSYGQDTVPDRETMQERLAMMGR